MKYVLIALVWVIAVGTAMLSLLAAWIGRADWGDGGASQLPLVQAVGLVVLAALAPGAAWWLTRRLLR